MIFFRINLDDVDRIIIETENRDGPIVEEIVSQEGDESLKKARMAIYNFWENIKNNMRRIVIHGDTKEVLDEILNEINNNYNKVKEEVSGKYINMIEGVAKKVSTIWQKVFQMAILSLPRQLESGDNTYIVKYYSIGLNIKVGSNLGMSLNELFRFLYEGTLSVRIRYELE